MKLSLIKTTTFVVVLFASHLAVVSVSVPAASRSLAGCGYTAMTGSETLYYGRDQQVAGTVNWQLSDDGISVTYNVNSGCTPGTAHVELSDSVLPRPIPGKFDCKQQGSGSSFTVVCGNENFSDLSCCSTKYLYTHLELTCGDEDETAFSGENKCSGKRWCNYVSIPPPCNGCNCDSANDKCFQKTTCGVFPKTCTTTLVCEDQLSTCVTPTSCTSPKTCTPLTCPDPVYPGVPTTCRDPDVDCGATFCNKEPVCEQAQCNPPAVTCGAGKCNAGSVVCEDSQCLDPAITCGADKCNAGSVVCEDSQCLDPAITCGADKCNAGSVVCEDSQCLDPAVTCGADNCNEGDVVCNESDCTNPSNCNLAACPDVVGCPGECECPGECPPCFIPDVVDGKDTCVPDPNETDLCNPCKKGGKLCQTLGGLSNDYKCCPPTSECKKTTFKNRLGADQGDREVSFVCSSQCGVGCHLAESSIPDQSRACSLFQPLDLKNDGDPLTDDIFNTCPTLTMDTSTTPP